MALAMPASAQWKDDVGYTRLRNEVGDALEDGSGVEVAVAEARVGGNYLPDFDDPEFAGKTITDASDLPSDTSGHATGVFRNFVGNTISMAGGVTDITLYEAPDWADRVLGYATGRDPELPTFKIQSNSWIGNFGTDTAAALNFLHRVDYTVNESDVLMVGGTSNNRNANALPDVLVNGYNSLIVGRSDGNHAAGFTDFYGAGRVKPDIVAPQGSTSNATPVVASAAGLLHEAGAGTNAVRSETMRAILMAGATKVEPEFAEAPNQPWNRTTTRPLDERFGAGELNVYNSYQILQGGEFAASAGQPTFAVGLNGWSYVEQIADGENLYYDFVVGDLQRLDDFSIMLNWNIEVTDLNPDEAIFDPETSLANLDMRLFDSSDEFLGSLVDASLSSVDNLEHIFTGNLRTGRYTLEISADGATDFGLAWRGSLTAVPEPGMWAGLMLIATGITARRIRSARRCRGAGCDAPDSDSPHSANAPA
jgi:hypothetical protein